VTITFAQKGTNNANLSGVNKQNVAALSCNCENLKMEFSKFVTINPVTVHNYRIIMDFDASKVSCNFSLIGLTINGYAVDLATSTIAGNETPIEGGRKGINVNFKTPNLKPAPALRAAVPAVAKVKMGTKTCTINFSTLNYGTE
jgi:hypothetical protein